MVVVNPILPFSGRVASRLPLWHKLWSVASLRLWQQAGNSPSPSQRKQPSPVSSAPPMSKPHPMQHRTSPLLPTRLKLFDETESVVLTLTADTTQLQDTMVQINERYDMWLVHMGYLTINWYTYSGNYIDVSNCINILHGGEVSCRWGWQPPKQY